jgi:hypothetical protein
VDSERVEAREFPDNWLCASVVERDVLDAMAYRASVAMVRKAPFDKQDKHDFSDCVVWIGVNANVDPYETQRLDELECLNVESLTIEAKRQRAAWIAQQVWQVAHAIIEIDTTRFATPPFVVNAP